MNVPFDIETIPDEKFFDEFLQAEQDNFKAPSSLTKTQACADLGITDAKEIKFTSKDDAIAKWQEEFKTIKAPAVAEEKWKKCSFDAAKGQICSIAWAIEDGDVENIGAYDGTPEEDVIGFFFSKVATECHRRTPFLIGHYIGGFDLKFLWRRAVILGIEPPFPLPFAGRHGKDFYCTQTAWCGYKDTISMDNLAKALGIEGKGDMDGSMVWPAWKAGEFDKVCEYNVSDVEVVRNIFNRLTFGS